MGFLKKHFSMYSHLPKEIYVLAFGKVMTSMGALIWPMLTLIMSEKLGLNGQTNGLYMMIFSLFMGLNALYYQTGNGIFILAMTVIISIVLGIEICKRQEVSR